MTVHTLKCWPEFFESIVIGVKRFEIRKADRPYRVGDILALQEWDNVTRQYTGNSINMDVDYIMSDIQFGIQEGYIVMSISKTGELE